MQIILFLEMYCTPIVRQLKYANCTPVQFKIPYGDEKMIHMLSQATGRVDAER